jgi:hypothetical protein
MATSKSTKHTGHTGLGLDDFDADVEVDDDDAVSKLFKYSIIHFL